jgi:hypothetical protein
MPQKNPHLFSFEKIEANRGVPGSITGQHLPVIRLLFRLFRACFPPVFRKRLPRHSRVSIFMAAKTIRHEAPP